MPSDFTVNTRVKPDLDFLAAIQAYAAIFDRVAKLRSYASADEDVAVELTAAERALAGITTAIYGPDTMLRMAGALEAEPAFPDEQPGSWFQR